MSLNTLNTDAISFKKLGGKAHTQQTFAITEEGIGTNVQLSYSTVFANSIVSLPVTDSGLTSLYNTNGVVERVKFEIDIIPDTQIAVGRSQGYRLKLPSDYNTFGELYPQFSAGTYLHTALGRLQIVPSLYGKLKNDGTTEYDPILYTTLNAVIPKFDPINWYFDPYSGTLFIQDPPSGYDTSSARPKYLEAFLFIGDYVDDLLTVMTSGNTGTTASNVGGGAGIFKDKVVNDLRFKSIVGSGGINVSALTNTILISFSSNVYTPKITITGNTTLTASNFVVFCNTTISGFTVTLPASPVDGQVYKIKDVGNAYLNNVIVNGNGKTIDTTATVTINTERGGFELCYDSNLNGWFVMNFVG